MNTIGIQQAVKNLPQIIQYTLDNCEETVIVSDRGVVVMVDQHEWENMRETLRLFRDKKSLDALPLSKPRYNLEELLKGISEDNLHKEVDTGIPQGNEIW